MSLCPYLQAFIDYRCIARLGNNRPEAKKELHFVIEPLIENIMEAHVRVKGLEYFGMDKGKPHFSVFS